MSSVYKPPQGKGTLPAGVLLGIGISALLFLAIPLTQIFTKYEKAPEEIQSIDIAPPPPPEEPPPPPEPEQEKPPPELDTPPPPISLEQLDMALSPGTGGEAMAGDFALPTFDVSQRELGGLEIFELGDVDSAPQPRAKIEFRYPSAAKRKGVTGVVKVEYIVNANGLVENITVVASPDATLSDATTDVLRRTRFEPATKGGQPVKVRMRAAIPYN